MLDYHLKIYRNEKEWLWEKKELELEEKIRELIEELSKLTKENDEKSIYIKRQRKLSLDYEEDACNTEKILLDKINDHNTTIIELNNQIETLKGINAELQEKTENTTPKWMQQHGGAQLYPKQYADFNRNPKKIFFRMAALLSRLPSENKLYSDELEQLKKEITLLRIPQEAETNAPGPR
ncbi:hypothetical protein JTB14_031514 [Gonioctena quinquepunctata]|nr:hypothetical protein JTB14_031514 [Gonioctena quinquepunctata]